MITDKQDAIDLIVNTVCAELDIKRSDLESDVRKRNLVDARSIIFQILHKELGLKSIETGKVFNRDHATVLHSIRSFENLLKSNKDFSLDYYRVHGVLKSQNFDVWSALETIRKNVKVCAIYEQIGKHQVTLHCSELNEFEKQKVTEEMQRLINMVKVQPHNLNIPDEKFHS